MPVSYTHLDVYKRQTKYYGTNPDGSGLDFTGYPYTNEIDAKLDSIKAAVDSMKTTIGNKLDTVNSTINKANTDIVAAVSYTHLDVYKRQAFI